MEKIKLPRSSYDELTRIISAYGNRNGPASLADISHATGINRTVVSANNAFLAFLEIIEGGIKKIVTEKGLKLARALEHDMPDQIQEAWTEIVVENDFLSKMMQALKIRRGMEISQFENHIAYSSGEIKSKPVMTGARAVVDLLLNSGKLRQDGDKLTAEGSLTNDTAQDRPRTQPFESVTNVVVKNEGLPTDRSNITLSIELSITAKPSDLSGLGKKIRSLLDEIRSPE